MEQKTIDFTRGEQLAILNQFCRDIPSSGVDYQERDRKTKISKSKLASVIRVIDDQAPKNGVCFSSLQTMGNLTGLSVRTFRRAINWLDDQGLVIRKRRGVRRTNTLKLVWNALSEFDFSESSHTSLSDRTHSEVIGHGAKVIGHGAQSDRPPVAGVIGHQWPAVPKKDPQSKRNRLTESKNRVRVFGDIDFEVFEYYLDRIGRIVPLSSESDSALQIKVAVMGSAQIGGCLSEADIFESLQAVSLKEPDNPSAYFCSCIRKRLDLERAEFGRLLASVPIPHGYVMRG